MNPSFHRSSVDRCWHVKILTFIRKYCEYQEEKKREGFFLSLSLSLSFSLSLFLARSRSPSLSSRYWVDDFAPRPSHYSELRYTRRRAAFLHVARNISLSRRKSLGTKRNGTRTREGEKSAVLPRATTRVVRYGTERSTHARTHARTHAGMHARTHECAPLTTTGRLKRTPV